jgi:hypothetical protein
MAPSSTLSPGWSACSLENMCSVVSTWKCPHALADALVVHTGGQAKDRLRLHRVCVSLAAFDDNVLVGMGHAIEGTSHGASFPQLQHLTVAAAVDVPGGAILEIYCLALGHCNIAEQYVRWRCMPRWRHAEP